MNGLARTRPAPPVRIVHLGLGNFFRAHQVWYTDRAPDAADWGFAAFTGRSARLADALSAQEGLYTLVTRGADGDRFDVVRSLARAHSAADHEAWLGYLADPQVTVVTSTVTEAGYVRRTGGGLDAQRPEIRADVAALRGDLRAPVLTAPARLVAGLAARRAADAGPITLLPCDNLPDNGAAVARVVAELAELADPSLTAWLQDSVRYVTTMVDRITPEPTLEDLRTVAEATGRDDRAPVVTEPFTEWVLSGEFAAGRPQWQCAGATFTQEIEPFEQRKLWLLNGGHSLLAYAASIRGHSTVADAVQDPVCAGWLEQWWDEACAHLTLPVDHLAAYRAALLERFANPRMQHLLAQIASDGSQKLPVRILPALRCELAAGRIPVGATRVLAGWVCHLRGLGAPIRDAGADEAVRAARGPLPIAVRQVLAALDPQLAADAAVVETVLAQAQELARELAQP